MITYTDTALEKDPDKTLGLLTQVILQKAPSPLDGDELQNWEEYAVDFGPKRWV